MQEESGLFEIRFNEQGKKFIRKFVAISYTILVLVVFESVISIYWTISMLATRTSAMTDSPGFTTTLYNTIYPYISIFLSLIALISNFYYVRFPRVLLRCIELNDEFGANKAFGLLFKGAMIFLLWLVLDTAVLIWSLIAL